MARFLGHDYGNCESLGMERSTIKGAPDGVPTMSTRTPNDPVPQHDPLGGPEEASAITRAWVERGADDEQRTFVPMKIVGELHGMWRNEKGEITGELMVGQVAFYAPDFPKVEEKITELWPQAVKLAKES